MSSSDDRGGDYTTPRARPKRVSRRDSLRWAQLRLDFLVLCDGERPVGEILRRMEPHCSTATAHRIKREHIALGFIEPVRDGRRRLLTRTSSGDVALGQHVMAFRAAMRRYAPTVRELAADRAGRVTRDTCHIGEAPSRDRSPNLSHKKLSIETEPSSSLAPASASAVHVTGIDETNPFHRGRS
jgi:hypothetical protein